MQLDVALRQKEKERDHFLAASNAIRGQGPIGDLIEALKNGALDPVLQRELAKALDPSGESALYFAAKARGAGGAAKIQAVTQAQELSEVSEFFDKLRRAEPSLKMEAHVSETMAALGVSRSTVMKARKDSNSARERRRADKLNSGGQGFAVQSHVLRTVGEIISSIGAHNMNEIPLSFLKDYQEGRISDQEFKDNLAALVRR